MEHDGFITVLHDGLLFRYTSLYTRHVHSTLTIAKINKESCKFYINYIDILYRKRSATRTVQDFTR